ncbi:MAG: hypothetical protein AB1599_02190 [Planctomycetota bacterium]
MNPEASQTIPGHNLIIMRVAEHNLSSVIEQFADAFSLEIEPAEQILRSAPIVFLTGLHKDTLKILKDRLVNLSKAGVEFMISTRLSPTIPRVVWPGKMPNYAATPSGELVKYVDFQWRGNAFVCPNCAETFVFKRIGNPLARYLQVKEETPIKQAPTIASAPAKPKEPASNIDESDVVELPPITDTQSGSESDEVVELAPVEDQSQNNADVLEPIDILEGTNGIKEAPAVAAHNGSEENGEVVEAPVAVEEPGAAPIPEELCTCSVFLTSIPPEKKVATAELIAKMKGISVKQAQVLATRLLVPILKDVSKEEAARCLTDFQKIGVKGKLTIKK